MKPTQALEAVRGLADPKGSSFDDIMKYINSANSGAMGSNIKPQILSAIKSGDLMRSSGGKFLLNNLNNSACGKPKKKKKPKKKACGKKKAKKPKKACGKKKPKKSFSKKKGDKGSMLTCPCGKKLVMFCAKDTSKGKKK